MNEWGWTKVEIEVIPDNYHNAFGMQLYREQYPLTHPGASTVSSKKPYNPSDTLQLNLVSSSGEQTNGMHDLNGCCSGSDFKV